jgi:hypothetical protein
MQKKRMAYTLAAKKNYPENIGHSQKKFKQNTNIPD